MGTWYDKWADNWISVWYDEERCCYVMEYQTTHYCRCKFNQEEFDKIVAKYDMKKAF